MLWHFSFFPHRIKEFCKFFYDDSACLHGLVFRQLLAEPIVVHCAKFLLDSVSYALVRIFSGFWFCVILTGFERLVLFTEKLLDFFVVLCEPVLIALNGSS